MNRRRGMFLAGMVISAGFIVYAVTSMDFRRAMAEIRNIHPLWIIPFALANLVAVYLRAIRLRYILWGLKNIPIHTLFSAISIGNMGNMIFPMRLGELMQVYQIAQKEKLSKSAVFTTLMVEKVFDIISILTMFALTLLIADPPVASIDRLAIIKRAGIILSLVTGVSITFLYLTLRFEDGTGVGTRLFFHLLPQKVAERVSVAFTSFRSGLRVFSKGHHMAGAIYSSVVLYITIAVGYSFALPIFGLPYSVEVGTMITVCLSLGIIVPSSPGFVGPYHAAIVIALGLYRVDTGVALGVAIMLHFVIFLLSVGMGIVFIRHEQISYTKLRNAENLGGSD